MVNNFSAMILAAGFGKRMMPLTKNMPKPALNVNGVTLLDNSINFLKKLGCNQIVINMHYKFSKIEKLINIREDSNIITLIHEKEILDTGGGVKNAINSFKNENVIIINSDIFWREENANDALRLINLFDRNRNSQILLANKKNTYGLSKINGDFTLNNNKVLRFKKGDEILYYAGLQIIPKNIFDHFPKKFFSFNVVWDNLINKGTLYGEVMKSNLYHVGDIQGLNAARNLDA